MDAAQEQTRRFVVGLGNPGRQYAATRHNVGFRVLEALRLRWQTGTGRNAFGGLVHEARPARAGDGKRHAVLLAPQTYMNLSGSAVRDVTGFYKARAEDILVVLDDMDLPPGRVRVRADGSAGGHKGLADVLRALGTRQVPRLRIGIGRPPAEMDAVDYVLARFRPDEEDAIAAAVTLAADAVEDWLFRGLTFVMERYNRKADD